MKRFNRIISSVVLVCFVFNTAVQDYAFALSPGQVSGDLRPGGEAVRNDMYSAAESLRMARKGRGRIDFDDYVRNRTGAPLNSGATWHFVEADYANAASKLDGDAIYVEKSMMKAAVTAAARLMARKVSILTVMPDSEHKAVPVWTDGETIVLSEDFAAKWEKLRADDIWFEYEASGQKRTESAAWAVFYSLFKRPSGKPVKDVADVLQGATSRQFAVTFLETALRYRAKPASSDLGSSAESVRRAREAVTAEAEAMLAQIRRLTGLPVKTKASGLEYLENKQGLFNNWDDVFKYFEALEFDADVVQVRDVSTFDGERVFAAHTTGWGTAYDYYRAAKVVDGSIDLGAVLPYTSVVRAAADDKGRVGALKKSELRSVDALSGAFITESARNAAKSDRAIAYIMQRGVFRDRESVTFAFQNPATRQRFDITVIRPGVFGSDNELMHTTGHFHNPKWKPEIYQVIYGKAAFVLQRTKEPLGSDKVSAPSEIERAIAVEAEAGDPVVILPGYGHVTTNLSLNRPLVLANWLTWDQSSQYGNYDRNQGGVGGSCWYAAWDGANVVYRPSPNIGEGPSMYHAVPDLEIARPADSVESLALARGKAIYNIVDDRERFLRLAAYLNDPSGKEFGDITPEKVFVRKAVAPLDRGAAVPIPESEKAYLLSSYAYYAEESLSALMARKAGIEITRGASQGHYYRLTDRWKNEIWNGAAHDRGSVIVWERAAAPSAAAVAQTKPASSDLTKSGPKAGRTVEVELLKVAGYELPVVRREEIDPERVRPQEVVVPDAAGIARATDAADNALLAGRVAVITAAGGMSSRAGIEYPKGMHPIAPLSQMTLFAKRAEEIRAFSVRYGKPVLWYLMTSDVTDTATRAYFAENNYFSLDRRNVIFIKQSNVPAFEPGTNTAAMKDEHTILVAPNGTGGLYEAMHTLFARTDGSSNSGLLTALARGVDIFLFSNVDNPMPVIDRTFIGYHIKSGSDFTSLVLRKRDPSEGLAMPVESLDGADRFFVEYNQPVASTLKDRPGYEYGSINRFVLSRDFLERTPQPPYRVAAGKEAVTYKNGVVAKRLVDKLESFVFEAQGQALTALNVAGQRDESFAAFKKMDGPDSPAAVARAMSDLDRKRTRAAVGNVYISDDSVTEISAAFAVSGREITGKIGRGLRIEGDSRLYLGGRDIRIGNNFVMLGSSLRVEFEDPYDGSYTIPDNIVIGPGADIRIFVRKGMRVVYSPITKPEAADLGSAERPDVSVSMIEKAYWDLKAAVNGETGEAGFRRALNTWNELRYRMTAGGYESLAASAGYRALDESIRTTFKAAVANRLEMRLSNAHLVVVYAGFIAAVLGPIVGLPAIVNVPLAIAGVWAIVKGVKGAAAHSRNAEREFSDYTVMLLCLLSRADIALLREAYTYPDATNAGLKRRDAAYAKYAAAVEKLERVIRALGREVIYDSPNEIAPCDALPLVDGIGGLRAALVPDTIGSGKAKPASSDMGMSQGNWKRRQDRKAHSADFRIRNIMEMADSVIAAAANPAAKEGAVAEKTEHLKGALSGISLGKTLVEIWQEMSEDPKYAGLIGLVEERMRRVGAHVPRRPAAGEQPAAAPVTAPVAAPTAAPAATAPAEATPAAQAAEKRFTNSLGYTAVLSANTLVVTDRAGREILRQAGCIDFTLPQDGATIQFENTRKLRLSINLDAAGKRHAAQTAPKPASSDLDAPAAVAPAAKTAAIAASSGIDYADLTNPKVIDKEAYRKAIRDVAAAAAFDPDKEVRALLQELILKTAPQMGAGVASADDLYIGKAKIEASLGRPFTIPAMNIRCAAFDEAKIAFETARARNVGAFILEIAPTEVVYTGQDLKEYGAMVLAGAIAAGWTGPVYMKLDHMRMDTKKYAQDPEKEIQRVFNTIKEAAAAGFRAIDIDSSVLEKDPKAVADPIEQQRDNFTVSARILEMTREYERQTGLRLALGVEVGEVGEAYITEAHIRAFLGNLAAIVDARSAALGWKIRMPSVLAIPTGTPHAGLRDPLTGLPLKNVNIAFDLLKTAKRVCAEYGMVGPVQHGASTLPIGLFDMFAETGTTEIHLATALSDIEIHQVLADADRERMLDEFTASKAAADIQKKQADRGKPLLTPEALRNHAEKRKLIEKYKAAFWNAPPEREALRRKLVGGLIGEWFSRLGAEGTAPAVNAMYAKPEAADIGTDGASYSVERIAYSGEEIPAEAVGDMEIDGEPVVGGPGVFLANLPPEIARAAAFVLSNWKIRRLRPSLEIRRDRQSVGMTVRDVSSGGMRFVRLDLSLVAGGKLNLMTSATTDAFTRADNRDYDDEASLRAAIAEFLDDVTAHPFWQIWAAARGKLDAEELSSPATVLPKAAQSFFFNAAVNFLLRRVSGDREARLYVARQLRKLLDLLERFEGIYEYSPENVSWTRTDPINAANSRDLIRGRILRLLKDAIRHPGAVSGDISLLNLMVKEVYGQIGTDERLSVLMAAYTEGAALVQLDLPAILDSALGRRGAHEFPKAIVGSFKLSSDTGDADQLIFVPEIGIVGAESWHYHKLKAMASDMRLGYIRAMGELELQYLWQWLDESTINDMAALAWQVIQERTLAGKSPAMTAHAPAATAATAEEKPDVSAKAIVTRGAGNLLTTPESAGRPKNSAAEANKFPIGFAPIQYIMAGLDVESIRLMCENFSAGELGIVADLYNSEPGSMRESHLLAVYRGIAKPPEVKSAQELREMVDAAGGILAVQRAVIDNNLAEIRAKLVSSAAAITPTLIEDAGEMLESAKEDLQQVREMRDEAREALGRIAKGDAGREALLARLNVLQDMVRKSIDLVKTTRQYRKALKGLLGRPLQVSGGSGTAKPEGANLETDGAYSVERIAYSGKERPAKPASSDLASRKATTKDSAAGIEEGAGEVFGLSNGAKFNVTNLRRVANDVSYPRELRDIALIEAGKIESLANHYTVSELKDSVVRYKRELKYSALSGKARRETTLNLLRARAALSLERSRVAGRNAAQRERERRETAAQAREDRLREKDLMAALGGKQFAFTNLRRVANDVSYPRELRNIALVEAGKIESLANHYTVSELKGLADRYKLELRDSTLSRKDLRKTTLELLRTRAALSLERSAVAGRNAAQRERERREAAAQAREDRLREKDLMAALGGKSRAKPASSDLEAADLNWPDPVKLPPGKRVVMLISGGEAAGVNNYFALAARKLAAEGYSVEAVKFGLDGLVKAKAEFDGLRVWVDWTKAGTIMDMPGAFAGTARVKLDDKKHAEYMETAIANLKGYCRNVVIIGGNDHIGEADKVAKRFAADGVDDMLVVALPKTIDRDTKRYPMGASTAAEDARELVSRARAARGSGRCVIVQSMGRDMGYLTAASADLDDPTVVVALPEYSYDRKSGKTIASLADIVSAVRGRMSKYGAATLVVSEGFMINMPEEGSAGYGDYLKANPTLAKVLASPYLKAKLDRFRKDPKAKDDQGNLRLGELGIADFIAEALSLELGLERDNNLLIEDSGYSCRARRPNALDRAIADSATDALRSLIADPSARAGAISRGGVCIAARIGLRHMRDASVEVIDLKDATGKVDLGDSGIYTAGELRAMNIVGLEGSAVNDLPDLPGGPEAEAPGYSFGMAVSAVDSQSESALDMKRANICVIARPDADGIIDRMESRQPISRADAYIIGRTSKATVYITASHVTSFSGLVKRLYATHEKNKFLNVVISGGFKVRAQDALITEMKKDEVAKALIESVRPDSEGNLVFGRRLADLLFIALSSDGVLEFIRDGGIKSERSMSGVRKNILGRSLNLLPGEVDGAYSVERIAYSGKEAPAKPASSDLASRKAPAAVTKDRGLVVKVPAREVPGPRLRDAVEKEVDRFLDIIADLKSRGDPTGTNGWGNSVDSWDSNGFVRKVAKSVLPIAKQSFDDAVIAARLIVRKLSYYRYDSFSDHDAAGYAGMVYYRVETNEADNLMADPDRLRSGIIRYIERRAQDKLRQTNRRLLRLAMDLGIKGADKMSAGQLASALKIRGKEFLLKNPASATARKPASSDLEAQGSRTAPGTPRDEVIYSNLDERYISEEKFYTACRYDDLKAPVKQILSMDAVRSRRPEATVTNNGGEIVSVEIRMQDPRDIKAYVSFEMGTWLDDEARVWLHYRADSNVAAIKAYLERIGLSKHKIGGPQDAVRAIADVVAALEENTAWKSWTQGARSAQAAAAKPGPAKPEAANLEEKAAGASQSETSRRVGNITVESVFSTLAGLLRTTRSKFYEIRGNTIELGAETDTFGRLVKVTRGKDAIRFKLNGRIVSFGSDESKIIAEARSNEDETTTYRYKGSNPVRGVAIKETRDELKIRIYVVVTQEYYDWAIKTLESEYTEEELEMMTDDSLMEVALPMRLISENDAGLEKFIPVLLAERPAGAAVYTKPPARRDLAKRIPSMTARDLVRYLAQSEEGFDKLSLVMKALQRDPSKLAEVKRGLERAVSGSRGNDIWKVSTGKLGQTIVWDNDAQARIMSPDGNTVVDVPDGAFIESGDFTADGRFVFIKSGTGVPLIYDCRDLSRKPVKGPGFVEDWKLSGNGRFAAVMYRDKYDEREPRKFRNVGVVVYDLHKDTPQRAIISRKTMSVNSRNRFSVKFSADSGKVTIGYTDHNGRRENDEELDLPAGGKGRFAKPASSDLASRKAPVEPFFNMDRYDFGKAPGAYLFSYTTEDGRFICVRIKQGSVMGPIGPMVDRAFNFPDEVAAFENKGTYYVKVPVPEVCVRAMARLRELFRDYGVQSTRFQTHGIGMSTTMIYPEMPRAKYLAMAPGLADESMSCRIEVTNAPGTITLKSRFGEETFKPAAAPAEKPEAANLEAPEKPVRGGTAGSVPAEGPGTGGRPVEEQAAVRAPADSAARDKANLKDLQAVIAEYIAMVTAENAQTGQAAVPQLVRQDMERIYRAVDELHGVKMRILLPQRVQVAGRTESFRLEDPVVRTLKQIQDNVRNKGGSFAWGEYTGSENLGKLLKGDEGVLNIVVTEETLAGEVGALLAARPELFANTRLYNMSIPGYYSALDRTGRSVCQARAITLAILIRLYKEGDIVIRPLLDEMLAGRLPEGVDKGTFIDNIPERIGETDIARRERLGNFLAWRVSLVETLGRQLRILEKFVWSAA